ncbi:MAG: hypothetical protein ACHQ2Z_11590 [Elusimicrobiota bacterium]
MMRKRTGRKQATHRKGNRGGMKAHGRRSMPRASPIEMGNYDPNRGEATS